MKILSLNLFILLSPCMLFSQAEGIQNPDKGSIPSFVYETKTGLLFFNNAVIDGYTIQVDGVVSAAKHPYMELKNGNLLVYRWMFDKEIKARGDTPKKILRKYMLQELEYITTNTSNGSELKRNSRFIPLIVDSLFQTIDSLNFWHYDIYKPKGKAPNAIKTAFYMDGYFDNYFIRLTYYSKSGSEEEAEKDMIRIFKSILIYSGKIEVIKLDKAIRSGKYSYDQAFD